MTEARRNRGRTALGLAGSIIAGLIAVGHAASPAFWRVSTQAELLRGEVENLSVDASGQLRLAPRTNVVFEATAPFLWSAAYRDRVLWVGSGSDGKVFRIAPDGTARTIFDALPDAFVDSEIGPVPTKSSPSSMRRGRAGTNEESIAGTATSLIRLLW